MSEIDLVCVNGNVHKSVVKKQNCTMCANKSSNKNKELKVHNCEKCGKKNLTLKQKLKYHKCKYNFHQLEQDAWMGDAIHTLDLITILESKGYTKSCSNTVLAKLKSAEHQVQYLLSQDIIIKEDLENYNVHKLSSIFESKYKKDEIFRQLYKNQVILDTKNVLFGELLDF